MNAAAGAKVLVVEDNTDLARVLVDNLRLEGYQVDAVAQGDQALIRMQTDPPALTLLDVMLPVMDGYAVLRQARAQGYGGLVLMLTARGEEADKVRGLRAGADDYVTKPFGLLELLARVAALLRRAPGAASASQDHRFGQILVEVALRRVLCAGIEVGLTPKEFDLLHALLKRSGAVATREQLLAEVWGHSGMVETRTIDTHIAELRRKLEDDPAHPVHLLTVRKAGYRIQT